MVLTDRRRGLAMTVDFEDYRRQELRDHFGGPQLPHPNEVERQVDLLLDLFEGLDPRATFFSMGRLTGELRDRSGIGSASALTSAAMATSTCLRTLWAASGSGRISSEQGASEHALTHGRRH
jgi:hypothetical protein